MVLFYILMILFVCFIMFLYDKVYFIYSLVFRFATRDTDFRHSLRLGIHRGNVNIKDTLNTVTVGALTYCWRLFD